jgi:4-amino-4-deoxy-L-arabinose transferase-like glycosyltransferase
LLTGVLTYFLYVYATMAVGAAYNNLFLIYVALFSLVRTKLPNYITPAYPAVALLTGCFLYRYRRDPAWSQAVLAKTGLATLVLVGVGMLIGLTWAAHRYLPGEQWLGVIALVPLVGGIVALVLQARARRDRALTAVAVTSVLLVTALLGVAPVYVDRHRTDHALLEAIRAQSDDPQIATVGCMEPSWVFYAGRPIAQLLPRQRAALTDFFAGEDAFLITTPRVYRRIRPRLPDEARVVAKAQEFLGDGELLLVSRPPHHRLAARADDAQRISAK